MNRPEREKARDIRAAAADLITCHPTAPRLIAQMIIDLVEPEELIEIGSQIEREGYMRSRK